MCVEDMRFNQSETSGEDDYNKNTEPDGKFVLLAAPKNNNDDVSLYLITYYSSRCRKSKIGKGVLIDYYIEIIINGIY